jgi:hypothetical protein
MHAAASTRAKPSSTEIAANWQTSAHSPHAVHRSASTTATYPDDAIIGVPLRWACIAPQPRGYARDTPLAKRSRRHERQLQMA